MLVWALQLARAQDATEQDIVELVVVAPSREETETRATTTLGQPELARTAGQDLGESLAVVPGVSAARGTSDATKPVIRGQYERRLLILFDGVRHESQKWGLDHAPEIDPFAAGEISVVRGAAGVRHGPDALGGVVLVEPPPLSTEPGVRGRAQLTGGANGPRASAAARLDLAPRALPGVALRLEGGHGLSAALATPDYVLGNTASRSSSAGARLAWSRTQGRLELAWSRYAFTGGVCWCTQNSTPADLAAQMEAEQPLGAQQWTQSAQLERPYQQVTHDLALFRSTIALPRDSALRLTWASQVNHRQEFDQVRSSQTGPQYHFLLRTHSADLAWNTPLLALGPLALTGGAGLAGSLQENVYRGLPLVPNFRALGASLFAYQRARSGPWAVELGARYDHLSRTAFLVPSARQADGCELGPDAARCPASYDTGSVTAGGLLLLDEVEVRLDLSSASRFPSADELFLYGAAPTSPVWAVGDPSLGVETAWGGQLGATLSFDWLTSELSVYAQDIEQYIAFAPALRPDGQPVVDVTIQGAWPRYTFRAVDARFTGIDGALQLGPRRGLQLHLQGSLVRGRERATGEALPLLPADRLSSALHLQVVEESFLEVSGLYVAGQDTVPGYFLLGAALGATFGSWSAGLEATNLLNARYRDSTSLLRYYADEPGRDVRLRLGFDF